MIKMRRDEDEALDVTLVQPPGSDPCNKCIDKSKIYIVLCR